MQMDRQHRDVETPHFESLEVEVNDLQLAVAQYLQSKGAVNIINSSSSTCLENMHALFISKRSGFSSRGVLTCDPYKSFGEIGILFEIAQRITFEERVTKHKKKFLQILFDDKLFLTYGDGQLTFSLREGSNGHTFLKPGQVHTKIMKGHEVAAWGSFGCVFRHVPHHQNVRPLPAAAIIRTRLRSKGTPIQVSLIFGSNHCVVQLSGAYFFTIAAIVLFSVFVGQVERLVCTRVARHVEICLHSQPLFLHVYVIILPCSNLVLGVFSTSGDRLLWQGASISLDQLIPYTEWRQLPHIAALGACLVPSITPFAALYGRKPPNILGCTHHRSSPAVLVAHKLAQEDVFPLFLYTVALVQIRIMFAKSVSWVDVIDLFIYFAPLHLEDNVNLKKGE